jgi:hypothetical protein
MRGRDPVSVAIRTGRHERVGHVRLLKDELEARKRLFRHF